jgi:hypothetical protein
MGERANEDSDAAILRKKDLIYQFGITEWIEEYDNAKDCAGGLNLMVGQEMIEDYIYVPDVNSSPTFKPIQNQNPIKWIF